VAAAQNLYEIAKRPFDTETDVLRASDVCVAMAGESRSAANSLQMGLRPEMKGGG